MRGRTIQNAAFLTLRHTIGAYLRWRTRLTIHDPEGIGRTRQALLVIGNHVSLWDPFLLALAFNRPVHFLAADGNFRSRVMRTLLRLLVDAIPKAKARTDMEAIRAFQNLVAQRRIVSLFPEGQRCWDGSPREVLPGIEKLARLLGARVVATVFEGAYHSNPRWGVGIRRGGMRILVRSVCSAAETRKLRRDELARRIAVAIHHDADEWQRKNCRPYPNPRRAEFLETALFACPDCGRFGSLESSGARLRCNGCAREHYMDRFGTLHRDRLFSGTTSTVRMWNLRQLELLNRRIADAARDPQLDIAWLEEVDLLSGYRSKPLRHMARGRLVLNARDLHLIARSDGTILWHAAADELSAVNVQFRQSLEFYARGVLWVVRPTSPRASSYWMEQAILRLQTQ